MKYLILFLLIIVNFPARTNNSMETKEYIYVGTYTQEGEAGIYVYKFDRDTGKLTLVQEVGGMESPSYLEINPSGKYLYSVNGNSVVPDKKWGSVSSYSIDQATGKISHMNDQPAQGAGPCHINIDSKGRMVFVSNYSSGSIVAFPVQKDGGLGAATDVRQHAGSSINESRQKGPHVHNCIVSPDDKFIYVSDLGIDRVVVYAIDYKNKKLEAHPSSDGNVEAGSGPRHFCIDGKNRFGYVINELSSTVTAYKIDKETGALDPIQTISTVPEGFSEVNYCADIHIDPSGRYLYGSNRGHNSLAIFRIDENSGKLTLVGHESTYGEWPRNFLIHPEGEYIFVANQNSDNIVIYRRDVQSGLLSKIEEEIEVHKPVCLKILQIQ